MILIFPHKTSVEPTYWKEQEKVPEKGDGAATSKDMTSNTKKQKNNSHTHTANRTAQESLSVQYEKTPLHQEETDNMTVLSFDVAAFKSDELTINLEDHVLTVTGSRQNRLGDTFMLQRRFALQKDKYDEDSVQVNLTNGILDIVVQKRQHQKAKKIEITVKAN